MFKRPTVVKEKESNTEFRICVELLCMYVMRNLVAITSTKWVFYSALRYYPSSKRHCS